MILKEIDVPAHIMVLVKSLYECDSMLVKTKDEESGTFWAERGPKQEYIMSPLLFNIYMTNVSCDGYSKTRVKEFHS